MSAAKVATLKLVSVGEGIRLDADQVLEAAKGQDLRSLVIIGETAGGDLWVSSIANAGESLIAIERAKRRIVFGE